MPDLEIYAIWSDTSRRHSLTKRLIDYISDYLK